MASPFPSCGVSGRSGALVVFPLFVFTVGLHIKIFTWMTDHTSVMTVFWWCCFCSALFSSALFSLSRSYTRFAIIFSCPLSNFFRVQLLIGPIHIVWLPCISTFTGNYSHGVPMQNAVRGKHHFLCVRLCCCQYFFLLLIHLIILTLTLDSLDPNLRVIIVPAVICQDYNFHCTIIRRLTCHILPPLSLWCTDLFLLSKICQKCCHLNILFVFFNFVFSPPVLFFFVLHRISKQTQKSFLRRWRG